MCASSPLSHRNEEDPATYIEGSETQALLHVGEGIVFMVFGQDRSDIEPILAALVEGAASGT